MQEEIVEAEYDVVPVEEWDPTVPLPEEHPEWDYVPDVDLGKRPAGKYCMARRTNEEGFAGYCKNPAGKETDHLGVGRCKFHGGASVVKHGYYSKVIRYGSVGGSLGELYEKYMETDKDPLDVTPDIALMRAIIEDFVSDYQRFKQALYAWQVQYRIDHETEAPKLNLPSMHSAYKMLDSLSKMTDREKKHKQAAAISLKDLYRVMGLMGQAVKNVIEDDTLSNKEKLREINRRWSKITPG